MSHHRETLTRQVIWGMLWTACGKGAQAVLQVMVLVALARLLSPAEFGVVNAGLIMVGFSSIFSQMGLGPAVVQRPELERRHLQTAFAASLAFGVLLGALIWLTAPLAARFFHMSQLTAVVRVLAWIFPLKGLATVAEAQLQREMRFKWIANLEVASYAVGYGVVGISMAWLGWGIWALVGAHIAQSVLITGILLYLRPPARRPLPEWRAFRELLYFGGGFTAAKIANYLALEGDNLVIGRLLGPVALGLYGRAYQLMVVPSRILGLVVDQALFPAMARVQREPRRLATAYRKGIALIALIMLPTSTALVLLAPEVVAVVLGPKWTGVVAPFQILAIGMLFRSSYKLSDTLARATGAVYRRAWRQALYALLVVGGSWAGHPHGITGVSIAVLLALTLNFLLMADLSLRMTSMTWRSFLTAHAPALALAGASGLLIWGATSITDGWNLAPIAVLTTAGLVTLLGLPLLVAVAPSLFLGADGVWLLQLARDLMPRRTTSARPGRDRATTAPERVGGAG